MSTMAIAISDREKFKRKNVEVVDDVFWVSYSSYPLECHSVALATVPTCWPAQNSITQTNYYIYSGYYPSWQYQKGIDRSLEN